MTPSQHRPDPPAELSLSAAQARQLAIAAALEKCPLPDSTSVLRRVGLLQLDPLSRVAKAHRLTCLARMDAAASVQDVDSGLWSDTRAIAFEAWVHAVCLVPVKDWPLLRLARERARSAPGRPPGQILAAVLAIVANNPGGATITDIEGTAGGTRGWNWSARKTAAEYMLRTGELACSTRRGTRRIYDLPERRIPADLLAARVPDEQILATIAAQALAAMGVATSGDVARYYNLTDAQARTGLQATRAWPAAVEGWLASGTDGRPLPMTPAEPWKFF